MGGLVIRLAAASLRRLLRPADFQARVDYWQYKMAIRYLISDLGLPRRILSAQFLRDVRKYT